MPEAGSSGQLDASVCSLYDPPSLPGCAKTTDEFTSGRTSGVT